MRTWIWAVAAAALALVLGIGYWLYDRGHEEPPGTTLHKETLRPTR